MAIRSPFFIPIKSKAQFNLFTKWNIMVIVMYTYIMYNIFTLDGGGGCYVTYKHTGLSTCTSRPV